jgi:hypothetical protein
VVGVQLSRGIQHGALVRVERCFSGAHAGWASLQPAAFRAGSGQIGTEAGRGLAERHVLELLDEGDRVSARGASETPPTAGTGEDHQVRTTTVGMEWAAPDEGGAGAPQFHPVAAYHVEDGMLVANPFGVDAGDSTPRRRRGADRSKWQARPPHIQVWLR